MILTLIFWLNFDFIFFSLVSINFPNPVDARSLAIPLIPKQSGLFGVIDKSIKFDWLLEKNLFPIFLLNFDWFNSTIPSLSSDKFNSDPEQSIP